MLVRLLLHAPGLVHQGAGAAANEAAAGELAERGVGHGACQGVDAGDRGCLNNNNKIMSSGTSFCRMHVYFGIKCSGSKSCTKGFKVGL